MYTNFKRSYLSALVVATLVISGCISSLHPLYTEDTILVDDRLLGDWTKERSQDSIVFNDISYSVEVTNEGDTTITVGKGDGRSNEDLLSEDLVLSLSQLGSIGADRDKKGWKFERASTVFFERQDPQDTSFIKLGGAMASASSFSITPWVPSMVPDGYVVKSIKDELPYYILTYTRKEFGELDTVRMMTHLTEINDVLYANFYPFNTEHLNYGTFSANIVKAHSFAKLEFSNDGLSIYFFDTEMLEDLINNRQIRLKHEKIGVDDDVVITASTRELRSFLEKYGHRDDLYDDPEKLVLL